ncbi:hypothetical protein GOBAR_AA10312 [Gossypium barbadense]|uniref:DUF4283 domain-containing protein n=1 Tax=Gossypium barbadense TaxID=3634 RepID=A0A2P5Y460_GOSBA|nr:hypothetical protein GOBAR_AA10312 [Gossypium barbadense]
MVSWKDKALGRGSPISEDPEDPSKGHSDHGGDIENSYFLVKFQSREDYEMVLTQGPWIVFGQYLMVQSWSPKFNPLQPFPNTVMAWVRLPQLPGVLYK